MRNLPRECTLHLLLLPFLILPGASIPGMDRTLPPEPKTSERTSAAQPFIFASRPAYPNFTRVPLPRGTITGTIIDTNGRKVSGATIRVIGGYSRERFLSKENGEFTIPAVGAGKCDVEISSPYYYTYLVHGCIVAGDSTTVLDVRLTRKSRGHMGDALHRAPLPGERMGTIRSVIFDEWGRPPLMHYP